MECYAIPDDWATLMNAFMKVESGKQPDLFFSGLFSDPTITFGWIPYAQDDKEIFPERSANGNGYTTGDNKFEHVMILGKEDIELP